MHTTRGTIFGKFPDKMMDEIEADARKPEVLEWQKFSGRQYKRYASDEVRITMGPRGMFYLNLGAFVALGQPQAVEMMVDKKHRVIGIRKTDLRNRHAFVVRKMKKSEYRTIAAAAFCHNFRLLTQSTILFNDYEFDDDSVLRLNLVNATKVMRGAR